MTHMLADTSAAPRRKALVAAIAAAVCLGAPAAWMVGKSLRGPEPKHAARLDGGVVPKRELAFAPQDRALDDSLRSFKPGKAWTLEAPPAFPIVQASATPEKGPTVAKAKLAAAPRPPVRPATLAKVAPGDLTPRYADLPPQRRATAGGFEIARFVPTGSEVMKKIGGLGETMRDSIGSVGSSLGKLMRISSR